MLGLLAQPLMHGDHLLYKGGEETSGQGALLGEQGLELQAKLVGLALQAFKFVLVPRQTEQRGVYAVQRVFVVMAPVDGRDHLVCQCRLVLKRTEILLYGAEEMHDAQVDTQCGQATCEAATQSGKVLLETFWAHRRTQKLALALQ